MQTNFQASMLHSSFREAKQGGSLISFEEKEQVPGLPFSLANCPAVFLSYLSLWICYEIQLKNTKITMNNTSRLIRAIFKV